MAAYGYHKQLANLVGIQQEPTPLRCRGLKIAEARGQESAEASCQKVWKHVAVYKRLGVGCPGCPGCPGDAQSGPSRHAAHTVQTRVCAGIVNVYQFDAAMVD